MDAPDVVEGVLRLLAASGLREEDFRNDVPARVAVEIPLDAPGRLAKKVRCPILFCVCDEDSVAPAAATLRHAAKAPRGEIRRYPVGHFDIYVGEQFECVVADQLAFLEEHVPVRNRRISGLARVSLCARSAARQRPSRQGRSNHEHMPQGFREMTSAETAAYLDTVIDHGVSRAQLLTRMEVLLRFTEGATYTLAQRFQRPTHGHYRPVDPHLRWHLHVASAIPGRSGGNARACAVRGCRCRPLAGFEPGRLGLARRAILRQRDAIGLHQEALRKETGFAIAPPFVVSDEARQNATSLREEFGPTAAANWWDPGKDGAGGGKPAGLRKVVTRLERAADERRAFYARFAGGEEALLDRIDRVVHKWLSQCVHHTALGLPFVPTGQGEAEVPTDPFVMVGFASSWLFAQQLFLVHEIDGVNAIHLDAVWTECLAEFTQLFLGRSEAQELTQAWKAHYGVERTEDFGPPR